MACSIKTNRIIPWTITIPLMLVIFEAIATRFYPFSSPYFSLLFVKQPALLTYHSLIPLIRVFLAYTFLALTLEITTRRWIKPIVLRALLFLVGYSLTVFLSFKYLPGLHEYFPYISKTKWALGLGLLLLILHQYSLVPPPDPLISLPLHTFLWIVALPFFLWLSSQSPWEEATGPSSPEKGNHPSFLVLSFDAIPGDFFSHFEKDSFVTPLWHHRWKEQGTSFTNAYSVTNTTYTSWFSTLTGKMPLESNVLSLYPSNRIGNANLEETFPRQLQNQGYQTVFLTDCANTSFMKKEFGFNLLFQPDQGAFKSTRALVASVHPGLFAFVHLFPGRWFFPELTSFSSHLYEPQVFFDTIQNVWERLDQGASPYLLVVHSCITHRDVAHHLPNTHSPLRNNLPQFHSFHSPALSELFVSIRMADFFTDQLFSKTKNTRKRLWKFLISDHGIRIDPKNETLTLFSHGIGDALNRYQYNVPFEVLPPAGFTLSNDPHPLIALQDLGRFLISLSTSREQNHLYPTRDRLQLTSAVPSETPENWGKTLAPLIQRGMLKENGTFHFSKTDDQVLERQRSIALLELPYRAVWSPRENWKIFNEVKDPFNLVPLDLEKLPKSAQLPIALLNNPSSFSKSREENASSAQSKDSFDHWSKHEKKE